MMRRDHRWLTVFARVWLAVCALAWLSYPCFYIATRAGDIIGHL